MNKIFLLVCACTLLAIFDIQAQDYRPAIIYTRTADTIVCQIKVVDSYTNIGNFHYKIEGEDKEQKIYKDDIDSIHIGNKRYVFLRIHYKYSAGVETKVFQVLEEGFLTLYAKTFVKVQTLGPGGKVTGEGGTYQDYFLKKQGVSDIKKINRVGFKKNILKYVDRDDVLYKKIRTKEYGYDQIELIIKEYNEWYKTRSE